MRQRFGLLLSIAAAALVVACGGDESNESDGVFERDDYAFTFSYPDGFSETDDVTMDAQLGNRPVDAVAIAPVEGDDVIAIQRYELATEVGEQQLPAAKAEFERLLSAFRTKPSLSMSSISGFPALRSEAFDVPTRPGAKSRLTFLFDGNDEYLIVCQWTRERRDQMISACDQVLDSLRPV